MGSNLLIFRGFYQLAQKNATVKDNRIILFDTYNFNFSFADQKVVKMSDLEEDSEEALKEYKEREFERYR